VTMRLMFLVNICDDGLEDVCEKTGESGWKEGKCRMDGNAVQTSVYTI